LQGGEQEVGPLEKSGLYGADIILLNEQVSALREALEG
jgi:hypothetical protein